MSVLFKSDVLNLLQKKNDAKDKMEFVYTTCQRENDNEGYISVLVSHASHVLLVARSCHDWGVVEVLAGGILLSLQTFTPQAVLLLKTIN